MAVLVLAVLFATLPVAALAAGRIALVIGNSHYGSQGELRNPANDARLMAKTLQKLGFTVDLVIDADQKAMKRAVKAFGAGLLAGGPDTIGLFYYAGHGAQVEGVNYLIPVGAEIASEADVSIEAVAANDVLAQMQFAGNAVNLVFLDACRNNPMSRSFRSAATGLARVDAPRGSFVGYSTAPGELAADGAGENSPYALALSEELSRPGISIEVAHRNVRSRVLKMTKDAQTPWDSSSLTGEVELAGLNPEIGTAPETAPAIPPDKESVFWESVKDSSNPADFEAYLKRFPGGTFADLARNRLAALRSGTAAGETATAAAAQDAGTGDESLDAKLARVRQSLWDKHILYTKFDGHLLVAVADQVGYAVASDIAHEVGGYLVNVGSQAENDAIFEMIRNDSSFWWDSKNADIDPNNGWVQGPWIGLYQEKGAARSRLGWKTDGGGGATYSNWSKHQPNEVDLGNGPGAASFGGLNNDVPFAKWSDSVLSRQEAPGYVIEIE